MRDVNKLWGLPISAWVAATRTLFVFFLLIDFVLMGPHVFKLVRHGGNVRMWIDSSLGGSDGLVGFGVACAVLLFATLGFWWAQAWLTSRVITTILTNTFLYPIDAALRDGHVGDQIRRQFVSELRAEVGAGLSQVEFRPLSQLRKIPSRLMGPEHLSGWLLSHILSTSRGNYLIAVKFTSALVKSKCRREITRLVSSIDVASISTADLFQEEADRKKCLEFLFEGAWGEAVLNLEASGLGRRIFKATDLAVLRRIAAVQNRVNSRPKALQPSQAQT